MTDELAQPNSLSELPVQGVEKPLRKLGNVSIIGPHGPLPEFPKEANVVVEYRRLLVRDDFVNAENLASLQRGEKLRRRQCGIKLTYWVDRPVIGTLREARLVSVELNPPDNCVSLQKFGQFGESNPLRVAHLFHRELLSILYGCVERCDIDLTVVVTWRSALKEDFASSTD
jgi:hypothetical protein